MKHNTAFSERNESDFRPGEHPGCDGDMKFLRRGFWDDVSWSVYNCLKCGDVVACVGGGVHQWNYTVTNLEILAEVRGK